MSDRYFSTCGLMMAKDGRSVVVVVSGYQNGMEIWDFELSQVEKLWDVIPPEIDSSSALIGATMVTIKGGREFIFYGGKKIFANSGIWRYVMADNQWTKYFL
jgi:hypothetical protein